MSLDDVESDLDTIKCRSDARRNNREFPFHRVAFQPAVGDDSRDVTGRDRLGLKRRRHDQGQAQRRCEAP